jgi:hypothetical protein
MAEFTHRYVGNHASEVIVGDKVIPVEPGQLLSLSDEDLKDTHNSGLIDDESIMSIKDLSVPDVTTTSNKEGGGTK